MMPRCSGSALEAFHGDLTSMATETRAIGWWRWVRLAGLIGGPILAIVAYAFLPTGEGGLSQAGRCVTAVAVLMAVLWLTEALDVAVSALLPIVLLPLLDVRTVQQVTAALGNELIFLFLGGFFVGKAFEICGLHRRIALMVILCVGDRPWLILGGILWVTAFISMWVSNTATAIMMVPIAMGLVAIVDPLSRQQIGPGTPAPAAPTSGSAEWSPSRVRAFTVSLLLAVAYGASIGGMATPIGTAPNMIMVSIADETLQRSITFSQWMRVGVPIMLLILPGLWLMLALLHPTGKARIPGGRVAIQAQLRELGRITRGEIIVLIVFLSAVAWWIGREPFCRALGLTYQNARGVQEARVTDAMIAIAAALAMFIIPVGVRPLRHVLEWETAERVPWGVLVLFSGGLAMADAMRATGVDAYLGGLFAGLQGVPPILLILVLVAGMTFISELASNTALAATLLPVLAAAAGKMGIDPFILMFPAVFAAGCGFMLPVATPPNAIVFATKKLTTPEMIRSGFVLDVLAIAVITLVFGLAGAWLIPKLAE